jgi:ABC-type transport system involved in cytochrome c biogenesis permease subunit
MMGEVNSMELMEFLTVVLMVFALVMVLAGIFTAYFGSGKSRMIGVILLVVGLVVGILWAVLTWDPYFNVIDVKLLEVVWNAFQYILAALIGILIAVGIFLLAIMKA